MDQDTFRNTIYSFFKKKGRILPWRHPTLKLPPSLKLRRTSRNGKMVYDPYRIFISEVMLQQTQVSRVLVKYPEFISCFPTFHSLANASLKDVLGVWSGLGYNRRAKYLKDAAGVIVSDKRYEFMFHNTLSFPRRRESIEIYRSRIPPSLKLRRASESGMTNNQILRLSSFAQDDLSKPKYYIDLLKSLPGIGDATACAIVTYAFNLPTVFVETNIRAVYLYLYFKNSQEVSDKQIADLVKKTLDKENPRDWYYALMDYGAMIKKRDKFKNIQSKHYAKQSKFEGSKRQLRGTILKLAVSFSNVTIEQIVENSGRTSGEAAEVLASLVKENLLVYRNNSYSLPGSK